MCALGILHLISVPPLYRIVALALLLSPGTLRGGMGACAALARWSSHPLQLCLQHVICLRCRWMLQRVGWFQQSSLRRKQYQSLASLPLSFSFKKHKPKASLYIFHHRLEGSISIRKMSVKSLVSVDFLSSQLTIVTEHRTTEQPMLEGTPRDRLVQPVMEKGA